MRPNYRKDEMQMKRLISLLLTVVLMLSMVAAAHADEPANIEVSVGESQESADETVQEDVVVDIENDTDNNSQESEGTNTIQPETTAKEEDRIPERLTQSRAVIGANLDAAQVAAVYGMFGVKQGEVIELKISNQEEREYLEGYVEDSVIGTRSISSVYVELLGDGSGMDVSTSNITWCTPEMYISALATAGITDAKIIVAAPFEVSGTAALAGVYKAYEDMTGKKLDDLAKLVSTQELTITGELAAQIGSIDSTAIVNELKLMLDITATMTDEQIREQIIEIAGRYNVKLTETQINQLITLCRSLEGLDIEALKSRVEEVQNTLTKVSDAKTQVLGFVERARKVVVSVKSFFEKISDILSIFRS